MRDQSREDTSKKWVAHYLPLAEGGDPSAQIAVGWEYGRGKLFPKDNRKAEEWFRRAEKGGGGDLAIFFLIKLLHMENDKRIDEVFREKSEWKLGAIYMIYGRNLMLRGNLEEGRNYLVKASRIGHIYAEILLHQGKYNGIWRIIMYPKELFLMSRYMKTWWRDEYDPRVLA